MNRMCRLGEAEEFISEMDFSDVADDIAETEEDTQLVVTCSFMKEFYVTGMKRSRCSCRMWR